MMMKRIALTLAVPALALAAVMAAAWAQDANQPPPVETPIPPPPVEPQLPPAPEGLPGGPVETVPIPPAEFAPDQPVTPPPPEVIVPAPPSSAPPVAIGVVLGGLDKVAARTKKFEVNLKQQEFYNTLIVTAHACKSRPPEEPPESAAFLEIQERKSDGTVQKIFSGWMFASSPALNALEHPVYDVWVVACKTKPASTAAPAPPNS